MDQTNQAHHVQQELRTVEGSIGELFEKVAHVIQFRHESRQFGWHIDGGADISMPYSVQEYGERVGVDEQCYTPTWQHSWQPSSSASNVPISESILMGSLRMRRHLHLCRAVNQVLNAGHTVMHQTDVELDVKDSHLPPSVTPSVTPSLQPRLHCSEYEQGPWYTGLDIYQPTTVSLLNSVSILNECSYVACAMGQQEKSLQDQIAQCCPRVVIGAQSALLQHIEQATTQKTQLRKMHPNKCEWLETGLFTRGSRSCSGIRIFIDAHSGGASGGNTTGTTSDTPSGTTVTTEAWTISLLHPRVSGEALQESQEDKKKQLDTLLNEKEPVLEDTLHDVHGDEHLYGDIHGNVFLPELQDHHNFSVYRLQAALKDHLRVPERKELQFTHTQSFEEQVRRVLLCSNAQSGSGDGRRDSETHYSVRIEPLYSCCPPLEKLPLLAEWTCPVAVQEKLSYLAHEEELPTTLAQRLEQTQKENIAHMTVQYFSGRGGTMQGGPKVETHIETHTESQIDSHVKSHVTSTIPFPKEEWKVRLYKLRQHAVLEPEIQRKSLQTYISSLSLPFQNLSHFIYQGLLHTNVNILKQLFPAQAARYQLLAVDAPNAMQWLLEEELELRIQQEEQEREQEEQLQDHYEELQRQQQQQSQQQQFLQNKFVDDDYEDDLLTTRIQPQHLPAELLVELDSNGSNDGSNNLTSEASKKKQLADLKKPHFTEFSDEEVGPKHQSQVPLQVLASIYNPYVGDHVQKEVQHTHHLTYDIQQ